jgi:hypothetical protein
LALTVLAFPAVSAVLDPGGPRRALLRVGADVAHHGCDLRLCKSADDVSELPLGLTRHRPHPIPSHPVPSARVCTAERFGLALDLHGMRWMGSVGLSAAGA